MIFVSIIIPTYNEEKDIGECLSSLNGQSYKNFEIIVVDDGSTDKTKEIIKELHKKDKRVILIEGEHKGPGFSRNLGAKNAKGEILAFVDADMTFDKDYIKHLIKPILEDKLGKIIGTTHDYEEATNTDNLVSSLWGKVRVDKKTSETARVFRAIRKDKFIELGGFDSKYGYADDQTFWFRYKLRPIVAEETLCYHKNPETLEETYKQARWIGSSWKEKYWFFKVPVLNYLFSFGFIIISPFFACVRAIQNKPYGFCNSLKFYFYKFKGYGFGVIKAVWFKRYDK
jgi:glycosyltransferase involved in cell wall biosynthesis